MHEDKNRSYCSTGWMLINEHNNNLDAIIKALETMDVWELEDFINSLKK